MQCVERAGRSLVDARSSLLQRPITSPVRHFLRCERDLARREGDGLQPALDVAVTTDPGVQAGLTPTRTATGADESGPDRFRGADGARV